MSMGIKATEVKEEEVVNSETTLSQEQNALKHKQSDTRTVVEAD